MKDWDAILIKPDDLGKFVTHTNQYDAPLPLLHAKFKVNRIEDFRQYMVFPLPPHRKPVFDFLFLTHGSASRNKGMNNFEIEANTFFFQPAYEILASETMSQDIKGYYCHFDISIFGKKFIQSDYLNEIPFLQYHNNPLVIIPDHVRPQIINILQRLMSEYESGERANYDIICAYLLALFLELKPHINTDNEINKNNAAFLTQQYKNLLIQHIYTYQKVSEYASLLAISPNHLNRCVNATTGRTAQGFLHEMLVLEAKVLLKQTHLTVAEIAFKVCKKDPSDFSRFFKSQTGISPKAYREH